MAKWMCAAALLLSLSVVGCSQPQAEPERVGQPATTFQQAPAGQQPRSAVIWVKGLSCPLCVQAIKKELQTVRGVEQIDVDYEHEQATVTLAARKPPTREQLVQAIERTGYVLTKLEMH
jgi:copper chaperone CopZ